MYSFSGTGKTKTQPFDPPPNGAIFDVSLKSEDEVPVRITVANTTSTLGTYANPADGESICLLRDEPCRLYVEPFGYGDLEWHIELHRLGSRPMKQLPISVQRSNYTVLGPYESDGTYEATATKETADMMSVTKRSMSADPDGTALYCEEKTDCSEEFEYHKNGYLEVVCDTPWTFSVKEK